MREPQPGSQHPDEYRRSLNDPLAAGDDRGAPRWEGEAYATAFDVKPVHDRLQAFPDDELKRIPVVPTGTRLEQGATYVDLNAPRIEEFTATADIRASKDNAFVAKSEVDYELWQRLIAHARAA
jgi:hypothetical protein